MDLDTTATGEIITLNASDNFYEDANDYIQVDSDDFSRGLTESLVNPLTNAVNYSAQSEGMFGLQDKDDETYIRTSSGVYRVTYKSDRDDVAQLDFDEQYSQYESIVS